MSSPVGPESLIFAFFHAAQAAAYFMCCHSKEKFRSKNGGVSACKTAASVQNAPFASVNRCKDRPKASDTYEVWRIGDGSCLGETTCTWVKLRGFALQKTQCWCFRVSAGGRHAVLGFLRG